MYEMGDWAQIERELTKVLKRERGKKLIRQQIMNFAKNGNKDAIEYLYKKYNKFRYVFVNKKPH